MLQLKGAGVALITPFNKKGEVDYPSLKRVVEFVIEDGIDYLVVQGTTGESPVLTKEEKQKTLDFILDINKGTVPIVYGIGGNNTAEVIHNIKNTNFNGIDALLSVTPFYNKPQQEGLYLHYAAISEASPVPIILYNVPGRTSVNLTAETTLRLAHDFKNIAGIKEASGNISQIMQIIKGRPEGFLVISGDDLLTLPIMSLGADGLISVAANACPGAMAQLVKECLSGDYKAAAETHYLLMDFINTLFLDGSPSGVKAAMNMMGLCENVLRLPLVPVNKTVLEKIKVSLEGILAD
jgi:4-hydroxy-tetrahydrodipicolinate synthase